MTARRSPAFDTAGRRWLRNRRLRQENTKLAAWQRSARNRALQALGGLRPAERGGVSSVVAMCPAGLLSVLGAPSAVHR